MANTIPAATLANTRGLAIATLARHFPGHQPEFVETLFARVQDLFAGRYAGYQACDTRFHDLTHTCDATVCLVRILDGHLSHGEPPRLRARDFELAVAAILLHDSGYMKATGDVDGTGAKYTLVHVERSAQFAAQFLPALGVTGDEVRLVQLAIRCTGLRVDVSKLPFRDDREWLLGCALGTGDMLGQLASETYPHRLTALYEEFREGGVPGYASAEDLMRKTRVFWRGHVKNLLETQWRGAYRRFDFKPYFASIESNLDIIDHLTGPS